MPLRLVQLLVATVVATFSLAPAAAAATNLRPPVTWLKGEGNYTKSHRVPRSIDCIVIHVTEGQFWGSVRWLRSPRAHASSHFVVARNGKIIQLVHTSDIAWHAGNWKTNVDSVGIEHEGFSYGPGGFTDEQYRNSARLTAWLARRSLMPIDRKHIIAHAQVPAPGGGFGGSGHHTDPGPHWNWKRYLTLVRAFAHPQAKLSVVTRLRTGALAGIVPWQAETGGGVLRVEFVVDGQVAWIDRKAPFAFAGGRGLNTVPLGNGRHVLELRAYGSGTRHDITRRTVAVSNRDFAITTAGARAWMKVRGTVALRSRVWGAKAQRVTFRVDGRVRAVDGRAPFTFSWRTKGLKDGRHVLELVAMALDGRVARRRIPLVVSNRPARPKPKPSPKQAPPPAPAPLRILGQTVAEGQVAAGLVLWKVDVNHPARVEFLVDGSIRGADVAAPHSFGWNADGEAPGPHRLTARATGRDGKVTEATVTVTVAAAAAGSAAP